MYPRVPVACDFRGAYGSVHSHSAALEAAEETTLPFRSPHNEMP